MTQLPPHELIEAPMSATTFSLIAGSLLAWQVFFGTPRP
jgi:hypothetical protein